MKIMKFGGSSMGSAQNIRIVKSIVLEAQQPVVVVVSAIGGVTDLLIRAATAASEKGDYQPLLHQVQSLHRSIASELFESSDGQSVDLEAVLQQIGNILHGIALLDELSPTSLDALVGLGEILSSKILHQLIGDSVWFDSRDLIVTRREGRRNWVEIEATMARISLVRSNMREVSVFPGFIGSDVSGRPSTLGRGGSDFTASLLAAALDADELQIWTDVDGFMSADPKVISRAYVIEHLTYQEAMELSHFGAKVIYPPTIAPVCEKKIPVVIKNTFNRTAQGTVIDSVPNGTPGRHIKGISSIRNVSLLTLQGPGMVGVTGISMRLFGALARCGINVVLISQASSENSISFVVDSGESCRAFEVISNEFEQELNTGQILPLEEETDMAVVAVVGERMKHTTGVAGKLFHAIGINGVNIYAIAQGASEVNISVVIKAENLKKTLNSVHDAFFLSRYKVLHLFIAGVGTVGSQLIEKLKSQAEKLKRTDGLVIRIAGVSNSRRMLMNAQGMEADDVASLNEKGEPSSPQIFSEKIRQLNLANSVFVDCTASEAVASIYHSLLSANVNVVTANKIACSSDYALYRSLKDTAREKGVRFLFETNVGAALPIILPISDLLKSGDRVVRLEAVLSGTLNFIGNELSDSLSLSQVIRLAQQKGFSEPDPRIDLSGLDVARKILILAREAGYALEPEDIKIEPFIPGEFFVDETVDAFLQRVKELDGQFEERRKNMTAYGRKLRYVATLSEGKATVALKEIEGNHSFYHLEGSNNKVLVWTDNYNAHPMQVQGYGAGAGVTAAGVFADIIKVANI